jgi:predicted acylesterase/phospholipase RssA
LSTIDFLNLEYKSLLKSRNFYEVRKNNPSAPRFYILATNLVTGDIVAFSENGYHVKGGNSELVRNEIIPLSIAVSASSAFPPLFSPIAFHREMVTQSTEEFPISPHLLADAGIYDNTGLDWARSIVEKKIIRIKFIYCQRRWSEVRLGCLGISGRLHFTKYPSD